jgi:hypothetical protein
MFSNLKPGMKPKTVSLNLFTGSKEEEFVFNTMAFDGSSGERNVFKRSIRDSH